MAAVSSLRDETSSSLDLVEWSLQRPLRALGAVLNVDAGRDECVSELVREFVLAGSTSTDTSAENALYKVSGIDVSFTAG